MRWAILLPLLLGSCQFIPGSDASKLAEAEKAVAAQLIDPASAQFRNGRIVKEWLVCGEVNSRNRYGGYAGFTPYAMDVRAQDRVFLYPVAVTDDADSRARLSFPAACSPEQLTPPSQAEIDADNAEAMKLDNAEIRNAN